MTYNFDKIVSRKGTNAVKTDMLKTVFGKSDLIPLWVADMDFETPPFIIDALRSRLEHPVLGYTVTSPTFFPSIVKWMKDRHNWDISAEWLSFVPGVVHGIALVLEYFTKKGDKIVIQPPVYHPFRLVPQETGREVVYNPLRCKAAYDHSLCNSQIASAETDLHCKPIATNVCSNDYYEMDFENLESILDERCKVLLLSNPHNPAGIVWKKETLRQLAEICAKHNVLVVSDEIHSDLPLFGNRHTPFATVSEQARCNSITLHAPSKTFNIAGMNSSFYIIPDDKLRIPFYKHLRANEHNSAPFLSIIAAEAAFAHGNEWREQLIKYLEDNVTFVAQFIEREIPQIKVIPPQASFLIWLDCRELGLRQKELVDLFVNKAGLALNDGEIFGVCDDSSGDNGSSDSSGNSSNNSSSSNSIGNCGTGFMRLNIGCPRTTLEKALTQLRAAILA
ncbi:MAG: aminotransferase class I/II-fold pyridoxal phosphate-dependent enzyme [Bacteroidales bacterium]|jgi:cystathionine beta-lyase|nr:aminotransferase class I/II-fold pyridoxal phosphate-dependent enzyme [Bacteroidales bacterium]